MYTKELQKIVERAADLAAQVGVSDVDSDYEEVADAFVAMATGLAEGSDDFADARLDFDYLLEQALVA